MRFTDKVCLITSAGSGISRATAIRLAAEGSKVVVIGHSEANSKETVQLITNARWPGHICTNRCW